MLNWGKSKECRKNWSFIDSLNIWLNGMVENIAQKYFRLYKHDMIPQNLNVVRLASRTNMEKHNNKKRQIGKG